MYYVHTRTTLRHVICMTRRQNYLYSLMKSAKKKLIPMLTRWQVKMMNGAV